MQAKVLKQMLHVVFPLASEGPMGRFMGLKAGDVRTEEVSDDRAELMSGEVGSIPKPENMEVAAAAAAAAVVLLLLRGVRSRAPPSSGVAGGGGAVPWVVVVLAEGR